MGYLLIFNTPVGGPVWSGPVRSGPVRVPVLRSPVRSGFFRVRLVRSGPDPLGAGPVRSESHGPLVRCGPVRWSDLGSGPVPSLGRIRAIDNVNLIIRETPVTVAHSIVFSGVLLCCILISILQYGIRA